MGLGLLRLISLAEARERRRSGASYATKVAIRSRRGAPKKPRSGAPWPRRSASANAPSATCGAPRRLEECQARRAMAEPACGLRLSDFRRARRAGGRCRTGHESARPGLAEKTGDREPGPPARRIRARLGDGVEIPATGKSITLARSSRKPAAVAAGNTQVEHHAALPYGEVSAFVAALRAQPGAAARALKLVDIDRDPGLDDSTSLCGLMTAVCRPRLHLAPGFMLVAAQLSGSGSGKGLLDPARFV